MRGAPLQPDIETLLAPVSAETPAGISLRYEGTYDRVREARREDDPSLPMGDWEAKLKVADWGAVIRLCADALQKKSKDLQLATWLSEAWLKKHRFRGFAHGARLLAGLCDRYWADMYPLLGDDDDPAARVALFEWVDEVLSDRLRRAPFAEGSEGAGAYCLVDWETAGTAEPPGPRDDASDDQPPQPRPTRESLLARISLSGESPWTALAHDAEDALSAIDEMDRALAAHLSHPPSFRRIRDVLRVVLDLSHDGMRASGEMPEPPPQAAAAGEGSGGARMGAATFSGGGGGPITSRAEAYYRLAEAAEYLIRTEPHSPVPYLVKRAVQWGNMSLGELLYEFIGNPDDLVTIQRLLGMRGKE
jgi:type VI secretion system protein ImpA